MGSIRAESITKIYPGTCALDNVSIGFESGQIHAFIGKNGSGKSTLLKIFAGAVPATSGKVYVDDVEVLVKNPAEASGVGIATVFQELSLVPSLSVAENIFIGRIPLKKCGLVDWKKLYADAKKLLDDLDIDIDPMVETSSLTVSKQQMVEIAKAMSFNPKVLQLDEPTSALSQAEAETLFKLMRRLKSKDVVVIFVSHRLQELWDIADTCTVLRDGKFIGKVMLKETSRQELLNMMFGSVEPLVRPETFNSTDEVVLEAKDIVCLPKVRGISFQLRKGEVLGIAGMMDSGRTELLRAILGAEPMDSGELYCYGQKVKKHDPAFMKSIGIGMVQEDRKRDGIIPYDTVSMNISFASIEKQGKGCFLDRKIIKEMYEKQRTAMDIKVPSEDTLMSALSGGNQQKVILGRLLNSDPKILIFDEPSRGIDVATKQQIFRIIWDLSKQGITSLIVSSELEELVDVCTRILIMQEGKITGEVDPKDMTAETIYMRCMQR